MALRPLPFTLTHRQWWGLGLIYLAGLGWTAELIIPFLKVPHKAVILIIVLIVAEVSFVIGIAIMGKSTYKLLKTRLIKMIKQPQPTPNDASAEKIDKTGR